MTWRTDDVGMSASTILLFDQMVLKVEKTGRSSQHERTMMGWLDGKLPVPAIIEAETQGEYSFLLMSRLSGEMACAKDSLRNMENTVRALATGLKMLWQVDTASCPCTNTVADKLAQGKDNIESGLVDTDDFEPETLTTMGFSGLPDLNRYLQENRPDEDLVFSHGDFCLPNVFVSGRTVTGFLDWGNGGIADRWQDIALCVRSLRHNCLRYAGLDEAEYQRHKALLFHELGIDPNEEKIRYYILLDELF